MNNFSTFVYDGLSQNVSIVETVAGSVTSTKQFVWASGDRREERDGSGALTKQFYILGQVNSSTKYFYSKDRLGSVKELTDNSGAIQAEYGYDPFGQVTKFSETVASDFCYDGYYVHSRSGLNLTRTRAYNSQFGRFISRDPIGENGGVNLYAYVANEPITWTDPDGLLNMGILGTLLPLVPKVGGPLGRAGTALAWSIEQWIKEKERQECGEECLRRLERDIINMVDPVEAYRKFICCLKNECKFSFDEISNIHKSAHGWWDVLKGDLIDTVNEELKKLKDQLDPFKDLPKPPPQLLGPNK